MTNRDMSSFDDKFKFQHVTLFCVPDKTEKSPYLFSNVLISIIYVCFHQKVQMIQLYCPCNIHSSTTVLKESISHLMSEHG